MFACHKIFIQFSKISTTSRLARPDLLRCVGVPFQLPLRGIGQTGLEWSVNGQDGFSPANRVGNGFDTRPTCEVNTCCQVNDESGCAEGPSPPDVTHEHSSALTHEKKKKKRFE